MSILTTLVVLIAVTFLSYALVFLALSRADRRSADTPRDAATAARALARTSGRPVRWGERGDDLRRGRGPCGGASAPRGKS